MNELTVLLPAYNEEENIEALIERWQRVRIPIRDTYALSLKIVVINDGSSDKTKNICEILEQKYTNFTLINHIQNKGLGEAVKTSITYVVKDRPKCTYACIMDCDNTHEPKYILDMLEEVQLGNKTGTVDVVIASRYRKGSKIHGLSKYRVLASNCAKFVYRILLNVNDVKDYTCGYRLYSYEILSKAFDHFGNKIIEETGFSCMAELLYKLNILDARFKEIPFELRYDYKQGQSKMNVFKTSISSIKLVFRLRTLKIKR